MADDAPLTPPDPGARPADATIPPSSPAVERLHQAVPGLFEGEPHAFAGEITLTVPPAHLEPICRFLRDDPGCDFALLADISGADFPERAKRFQVAYHLASLRHRARLRLRVAVSAGEEIPSVIDIWPGADWFEREVFDMFGIVFTGHPRLVRILMPDDWVGFPLRKDYPLPGYPEQHLRYRAADVTRRAYVDISWKAAGEKAAAIVRKYAGRAPAAEKSPHVPADPEPPAAGTGGGPAAG